MKFKNKKTNEIKEVSGYTQEFAYSHNSLWEKVETEKVETNDDKSDLTVAQIKQILNEKGVGYSGKLGKKDLLELLKKEE